MNIQFQRAVDRYIGVPVCAAFSALNAVLPQRKPDKPPKRILIILLSEMGSLVLAYPMFARLKRLYPDASIHALLFAKNREVLNLLNVIPEANLLTVDDSSLGSFAGNVFSVLRQIRSLKFDVVIDCELFARVSSIFSYLSGAPIRVGFHRHTQEGLYRGSFITRPVMYNPYRHLSHQFLSLVGAIESETVPVSKDAPMPDIELPPMLPFSESDLHRIINRLHSDFPAVKDKKLVLVYPSGGLLPIRAWPLESYYSLVNSLLADGYAVGVIGLKADKYFGQAVTSRCRSPYCIDLTGYTDSVRHLLGLFHRASLLITNDGGPGQFAALTPVPAIIFFGPETPLLYRSLAKNAHCFHLALPCSPCLTAYNHRTSPCDGDNQCLKRITPAQVLEQARQMLAAPAA